MLKLYLCSRNRKINKQTSKPHTPHPQSGRHMCITPNLVKRLVFNYLTYFKYEGLANLFYNIKLTEFNGNSFLACNKHSYKEWAENYSVVFKPVSINYSLLRLYRLVGFKFESSRCF